MLRITLLSLLAAFLAAAPACAIDVCIDPGAPMSASTGDIYLNAALCKATGAKYVRVNFILGPWSSPLDSTRRGSASRTWKETYDVIINSLRAQGLEVYALIGAEAVKAGAPLNSEQYVSAYAANFRAIVGMFKDRVRVYESFNEPNDWAGGTTAQVEPYWFARMLKEIYLSVKINDGHAGDPSWQVTLVSGPLFTHDLDNGASYLSQVYQKGLSDAGWGAFRTQYGTYPLDGIGFHIYVKQGPNTEAAVTSGINTNLNATWAVVTNYEGSSTQKKFWISEFGWNTAAVSESEQARNLTLAFNLFRNESRVQMANWFQISDFGSTNKWGLFRGAPFDDSNKKPSWQAFYDFATAQQPTGSITGTVKDTNGQPIAGAAVSVVGGEHTATTDDQGEFRINGLLAGTYTLQASAFGYRSQNRVVTLAAGGTGTAHFVLLKAQSQSSPSEAKTRPNTSFVRLDGLRVTAVFPPDRAYAQAADRSGGIAVLTSVLPSPGDVINAAGYVVTVDGERVLTQAETQVVSSGMETPRPFDLAVRDLGGGAYGYQDGVVHDAGADPEVPAAGLNNVGLLVRVAGRVLSADSASGVFYVDDGSAVWDGSGSAGTRVLSAAGALPAPGDFVRVIGASSATVLGFRTVRLLRAVSPGGIEVVQSAGD